MKLKMVFAATMLACSSAVWAGDLTLTTKTTGQVKDQSTTYMTSTAFRTNSPGFGMDVMTDLQKGITYVIDHKTKTIRYTKLADVPGLAAFMASHAPKGKGPAGFNAGMNDLYGDPAIFKVENTGSETVMGRSCKKTRITSGKLVWEYSMDPALRSPIDSATMLKVSKGGYAALASYPKMAKVMSNLMEATSKLNGVALKTKMAGYNGVINNEVTSVSQSPIPAATFALPAGYTMSDQIAESEKAVAARQH
jgi:Domain of unknown function (DUF4412)